VAATRCGGHADLVVTHVHDPESTTGHRIDGVRATAIGTPDVTQTARARASERCAEGTVSLEADLDRRRAELEMLVEGQRRLLEVSRGVLSSLDPAEVLELIADSLKALIPHDSLVISETDWAARSYTPTLARAAFVDADAASSFLAIPQSIDSGIAGAVIRTGEPVNLADAHEDPRGVLIPGTDDVPEQVVYVPLLRHRVVAGTMKVSRMALRDQAFTDVEFDLIQLFASLASIAIQNAQVHRVVASQADTDTLTGLLNPRAFQRDLAEVSTRPTEPFALLMLDLDRFKAFNDTLGHPAGDALLGRVAAAIRTAIRDGDRAYRYGGDEFAILMAITPDQALQAAERVREAIGAITNGEHLRVTASVGVACQPTDALAPQDLVRAADDKLYIAKGLGGNQVRSAVDTD
jgi:diguanylate cyclase (GGDEF)-like protein